MTTSRSDDKLRSCSRCHEMFVQKQLMKVVVESKTIRLLWLCKACSAEWSKPDDNIRFRED